MATDLQKVVDFIEDTTVEPMMISVKQMESAINSLPSITGMYATVNEVEAAGESINHGGSGSATSWNDKLM